ncbi:MAG: phosphoribosylglycinamide formyltransferase [Phycisphaerae bacterium]|nr:phosphoribosylglycinamide formyltransferase [Phycisphaerae bacterium]
MSRDGTRPGLAVLISGGGRTLLNLVEAIDEGSLDAEVRLVIASKPCLGAERARARRLPVLVVPGVIEPDVLARMLADHSAQWMVLAGYVKYLKIPNGFAERAINIHPSLLPAFGGRGMYGERVHRAVIDAGCKISGCTVHLVDSEFDHGPIVAQRACEVRDDDTPESLGARVFELERALYPWAISKLISGAVSIEGPRTRIIV